MKKNSYFLVLLSLLLTLFANSGFAAQTGFDKYEKFDFLSKLDLAREPHSMNDAGKYATERVPIELLEKIRNKTISKIMVFEGEKSYCVSFFKELGVKLIETNDKFADGNKTSYFQTETGDVVIDFRNYGRDLAIQKALIYHFSGIPFQRMEIYLKKNFEYYNRAFYQSVKKAGKFDAAIIGYRRSIVRDITLRKIAFLKAEKLKAYFGDARNREKFMETLKSAYILRYGFNDGKYALAKYRMESFIGVILTYGADAFFKSSKYYFYLSEVESFIAGLETSRNTLDPIRDIFEANEFKNAAGAPSKNIRAGKYLDTPFDMRKFSFTLKNGVKKEVLCTRHPYGEMALQLARALHTGGAEKIMFIGSCGSLANEYRAGDIIVPEKFIRFSEYFKLSKTFGGNALYEKFKNAAAIPGGAKLSELHCSVPSVLIETSGVIDHLKKNRVSSIDAESFHLFKKYYMLGEVSAMFIATDAPGTGVTLENYKADSPVLLNSQMRIIDAILSYFEIEDVQIDAK